MPQVITANRRQGLTETSQDFIAAGCILRTGNRYVLEIQKPEKWNHNALGSLVLGVACIGGGLESGETVIEAVQRESIEEVGCTVDLRSSEQTIDVTPADVRTRSDLLFDGIRPAMICELSQEGFIPGKKVVVFLGSTDEYPKPGDLPAIIVTEPQRIFELGNGNLTVAQLRESGAEIRSNVDLPQDAGLRLSGILEFVCEHRTYTNGWFS